MRCGNQFLWVCSYSIFNSKLEELDILKEVLYLLIEEKDKIHNVKLTKVMEALSLLTGIDLEEKEIQLKSGDRLFLYTDGIIEVRKGKGEMYGGENFFKSVEENIGLNVEEFCDYVLRSVREWGDMEPEESFKDDVTLITMDIL